MKKSNFTVINRQFSNRQSFYLKDPSSDIFAILNQRIFPLHKNFLTDIEFFSNSSNKDQKLVMVDPFLDTNTFQMIIGYFYGKQLQFSRDWELDRALKVITYLKIRCLSRIVISDLQNNFDQYGFFFLLAIAYKYKIKWLRERCQQELILMDFQQLNYNRYDLFQLEREIFQQIMKFHELLKVNQNITGLRDTQIKKIIKQYCKINNIPENQINHLRNQFDKLSLPTTTFQQTQLQTRKRNQNVPNKNVLNQVQAEATNRSCQISSINIDNNKEVEKLKIINQQIYEKNHKLTLQIQSIKLDLQEQTQAKHQAEAIDQKFRKFEKMCEQQDIKYFNLKSQMEKLSPMQKVNEFQKNSFQSETNSTNTQKRSRKFSETTTEKNQLFKDFPILSRHLDC